MIKAFILKYAALLVLAGAALLLAALGAQTLRLKSAQLDFSHLQTTVVQDQAARANATIRANARHRDTERELQAKAEATKKDDDEKLRILTADRARLERLLRNRPTRPAAGSGRSDVPGAATAAGGGGSGGPGATGAGLYLEDGAFLVGEAARAKRLIVERDSCIRQYNDARAASMKKPGAAQ